MVCLGNIRINTLHKGDNDDDDDDNNNNPIQFSFIKVPSQQPDSQLQKQHKIQHK
jgi:hypothetical protein